MVAARPRCASRYAGAPRLVACGAVLGLASSIGAFAQVYRCTVDGRVVYADRPCASNAMPIAVDLVPVGALLSGTPNLQQLAPLG